MNIDLSVCKTSNVLLDVSFSRSTVMPNSITPSTKVFQEYQNILASDESLSDKADNLNTLIIKHFPASSHVIFDTIDMSQELYIHVDKILSEEFGKYTSNLI